MMHSKQERISGVPSLPTSHNPNKAFSIKHKPPIMSLHQVSDHTYVTSNITRSEHSMSLDEIHYNDDDAAVRGVPVGILGGDCDDDEFACSAATLHLFDDDWNATTIGNNRRLAHESRCQTSFQKLAKITKSQASIASLNRSRRIASILYESISEMLHTSHRATGLLALDSVTKNLESLARGESVEVQHEQLAVMLANGLKDLDELKNRSAAPSWSPLSKTKQAMFHKQKDQLVNVLSEVVFKIQELNAAIEEAVSKNDENSTASGTKKSTTTVSAMSITDTSSVSTRSTKMRQSSFHSDVSSITSGSTASSQAHGTAPKGNGAMKGALFRLPVGLTPCKCKPSSPQSTNRGTTSPMSRSTAAPFVNPRDCVSDIVLQDSFSSVCSVDNDDMTPKRPQRRGSLGATKSDSALEVRSDGANKAGGDGARHPLLVTCSLDDVVYCPRGVCGPPRLPERRRRTDVLATPPQRQRSFDGEYPH